MHHKENVRNDSKNLGLFHTGLVQMTEEMSKILGVYLLIFTFDGECRDYSSCGALETSMLFTMDSGSSLSIGTVNLDADADAS